MQGTQYATERSILCRGAFCGPTKLFEHEAVGPSVQKSSEGSGKC